MNSLLPRWLLPLRVRPSRTALGPRRGAGRPGPAARLLDGRAGRGARRPDGARLRARRTHCSSRRRPGACGWSTRRGGCNPNPVIDISDHVNSYWDRGLLGIAVDANFAANHFLYLLYVNETNALNPSGAKTSRLTRIRVTSANRPENPDAPETVLLGAGTQAPCPPPADAVDCIPADGLSHSIGTVRADPDGTLWLGSGDASGFWGADPQALRTYDEQSLAGKIIHVDRDGRGLPGHPFCPGETDLSKVCTKLYAKGFRNPYRFQLRPGAGPLVGDVGWNSYEELNSVRPGRSYGWPCYEGADRTPSYQDLASCTAEYDAGPDAHQPPAHAYPHSGRDAAVVAGPRYEAEQYPSAYRGAWFFGDYAKGVIWRMTSDAQGEISGVTEFATGFEGGVGLERAPNGDLVYVSFGAEAGTGSVHAHCLRQPRAARRRLRVPVPGRRAARRDAERRGLERPRRRVADLRVGPRQRRLPGRERALRAAHLRGRCPHRHAQRPRRAGTDGERHGRGARRRVASDRDTARAGRGGKLPVRSADRAQGCRHGRARRRPRRRGAALANHDPPRLAHARRSRRTTPGRRSRSPRRAITTPTPRSSSGSRRATPPASRTRRS